MQNIFEKFAPRWKSAVSRYARSIWTGGTDQRTEWDYDEHALHFSREYRNALEKHYRQKGMNVWRGTLDGWIMEWLRKQEALKYTLKVVADEKQEKLITDSLEKLKDTKDAQKVIDQLYGAKENETVYKVFSFKDNFKALAEQQGEEEAFNLGSGINERIIQHFSDRYFWRTQKDKRVRNTHMQLGGKCFLFSDPPTTVTKYGKIHIGNCGTDFGCRCWAEIAPEKEKVLKNYIVHEK